MARVIVSRDRDCAPGLWGGWPERRATVDEGDRTVSNILVLCGGQSVSGGERGPATVGKVTEVTAGLCARGATGALGGPPHWPSRGRAPARLIIQPRTGFGCYFALAKMKHKPHTLRTFIASPSHKTSGKFEFEFR